METAETMCSNGTHDYKGDNFMKTVSIINLKGGVAKTLTTVSMAYALSQQYNAAMRTASTQPMRQRLTEPRITVRFPMKRSKKPSLTKAFPCR